MKRTMTAILAAATVCGCATSPDVNKLADTYYRQPRTYESVAITGATEIRLIGSNVSLRVSNELTPLSIIPRDPGVASAVVNATERTVLGGLGIYTAGQVMHDLARQPQVVPQQVVRPEVVSPLIVR